MFGRKKIERLERLVRSLQDSAMCRVRDVEVLRAEIEGLQKNEEAHREFDKSLKVCEECGLVFKEKISPWYIHSGMVAQFCRMNGITPQEQKEYCPHCKPGQDEKAKIAAFARNNPDRVRPIYEAHLAEEKEEAEEDND